MIGKPGEAMPDATCRRYPRTPDLSAAQPRHGRQRSRPALSLIVCPPNPEPYVTAPSATGPARKPPTGRYRAGQRRQRHMPHVTPGRGADRGGTPYRCAQVKGTGHGGRVTKKDIMAYIEDGGAAYNRQPAANRELEPWERPGSGDLFKPTDDLYRKRQTPAAAPAAPPASANPGPARSCPSSATRARQARRTDPAHHHAPPHRRAHGHSKLTYRAACDDGL